jgi:hypothetical protein
MPAERIDPVVHLLGPTAANEKRGSSFPLVGRREVRFDTFGRIFVGMKPLFFILGSIFAVAPLARTVAADGGSAVEAMQAARTAEAALAANDFEAAISKLESAVDLRPDFPQLLIDLARAQVGAARLDDAVKTLERYARLGLHHPVEKADEFSALRGRKDFDGVVKTIAANAHPKGDGDVAFTLREVTGLLEGMAWRETTGEFYFGDVHHRAVWMRNKDGSLRRFTSEGDDLLGVHGLAVDETNTALWAATSSVDTMRGYTAESAGSAALVEIDLESGAIRRTLPVPRSAGTDAAHLLTNVAVAPDGSVFATDQAMPIVWRLRPGGTSLERFAESPEFFALQGISVLPTGMALLADQVNGLLRMDERGQVSRLDNPPDVTLVEIKGVVASPEGRVVAIQTNLRPSRVLGLTLDSAAESISDVAVLQSGHLAMGAPAQGCFATDGDFFFVGNSGASRFSGPDAQPTPPRQVPIMRTRLAKPKK